MLEMSGIDKPEGAPWRGVDLREETPEFVVSYAVSEVSVRSATHRCDLDLVTGAVSFFAHRDQETAIAKKDVPQGEEMVALARKVSTDSETLNNGIKDESSRVTDEDIEALRSIGYVE
jgi:hypothetical protein